MKSLEIICLLQETTVKEHLTCLCAGPIHLLGMCQSPVLLTYHGSARVMLFCVTTYMALCATQIFTVIDEWISEWIIRQAAVTVTGLSVTVKLKV